MPISSQDLLDFAELSLKTASNEVEYRMVAGRAYYSVYHACNGFAKSGKYNLIAAPINAGAHDQLYELFLKATVNRCGPQAMTIKRIGMLAKSTHKPVRKKADYDIHLHFNQSEAADLIEKVKILLNELSAL